MEKHREVLPLIPLRDIVVFPTMVVPLHVGREISLKAISATLEQKHQRIFLAAQKSAVENPLQSDIYPVGVFANILRIRHLPDGRMKVLVQGIQRGKIEYFVSTSPYYQVFVSMKEEEKEEKGSAEIEELTLEIKEELEKKETEGQMILPEELHALNEEEPGRLADLVASNVNIQLSEMQEILETWDVHKRLKRVLEFFRRTEGEEGAPHCLVKKLTEARISPLLKDDFYPQRRSYAPECEDAEQIKLRITQCNLSEEAREEAMRQIARLDQMHPDATEAAIIRTYVEWLLDLPWDKRTKDSLDLGQARMILNEDHYGLDSVKERVIEFLAVCKLKCDLHGPILCFVGPPGVGKTSLGRSIARAMGRSFVRASLGGLRDEAEIRGHRRTYVGAMPGRIIQGMKRAGTLNPVFMLDEIDKLGSDFRGDPAAALLEVLDPAQNHCFRDYYLNVDFDLSQVLFIATANNVDQISAPLRDRMEVIQLPGYSFLDKMEIAKKHLIVKQKKEHGIEDREFIFESETLTKIIMDYTREAGVRALEREIAAICRKIAVKIASSQSFPSRISEKQVEEFLGLEPFRSQGFVADTNEIGVSTGLAWTHYGGEIIQIEAGIMPGNGGLILTGQMGEVMQESAKAALSFIRSHAHELGIETDFLSRQEIHIHVPVAALPKDGPSAGLPITMALISLLRGFPMRSSLALTGEISLKGKILPVGGIREKILAAERYKIRFMVIPEANLKDLEAIPSDLRCNIEIRTIKTIWDAIQLVFPSDKLAYASLL